MLLILIEESQELIKCMYKLILIYFNKTKGKFF